MEFEGFLLEKLHGTFGTFVWKFGCMRFHVVIHGILAGFGDPTGGAHKFTSGVANIIHWHEDGLEVDTWIGRQTGFKFFGCGGLPAKDA